MSKSLKHLTVGAVKAIHGEVLAAHGGAAGIRDETLLESAVAAPQASMMGQPLISDPLEIAAAYLFYISRNHPFLDGNKRVAFAVAHTFLLVNGCDLELQPLAAREFMIQSIARGEFRFGQILEWITKHIRCE